MKKRILAVLLAAAVMCICFSGCNKKAADIRSEDGYLRIEFDDANEQLFEAIGAELDPHIFRAINTEKGFDESDWQLICTRIKAMKLQKIRMMIMPEWYEPENENDDPFDTDMDAFSWNNQDMYSVYRVLDMADELGIKVNLTVWGAKASSGSWLAYETGAHWISPPNNLDEWNENICALLTHLVDDMQYGCITELTPYNEPADAYYVFSQSEINFTDDYKVMVMSLDERMKKEGVRDYVELCTSDDGTRPEWLQKCVADKEFEAVSDRFNSHCYKFSVHSDLTQIVDYAQTLMNIVKPTGKQFTLNEFGAKGGGGDYVDDGVMDSYERGLLYGKMMTVFLGEGCSGMLHWCLFDQIYGSDGVMYRGLWKFLDKDWAIRPVYYAVSMVTQHTETDAKTYKGTVSDTKVAAAAVQGDNGLTYLLVNEDAVEKKAALVNGRAKSGKYAVYEYSENNIPADGVTPAVPQSGTAETRDNVTYVTIPANSFLVVTNLAE